MTKDNLTTKVSGEAQSPAFLVGDVILSAIERMSDDVLKEEQRVLTAQIEASHERLSSVDNEIFYRNNPECRRH